MSMDERQAQELSSVFGVEYTPKDCPDNVRFHEYVKAQKDEQLATIDEEIQRLVAKLPDDRRTKEYKSLHKIIDRLRKRKVELKTKFDTYSKELQRDHDSTFVFMAKAGYAPGKFGHCKGKKFRIATPASMDFNNQWFVRADCGKETAKFLISKVPVGKDFCFRSDLVLEGLAEALVSGSGAVPPELLVHDECEVIDGPVDDIIHYRTLRVRKLAGARLPQVFSIYYNPKNPSRAWLKMGWQCMPVRTQNCEKNV